MYYSNEVRANKILTLTLDDGLKGAGKGKAIQAGYSLLS